MSGVLQWFTFVNLKTHLVTSTFLVTKHAWLQRACIPVIRSGLLGSCGVISTVLSRDCMLQELIFSCLNSGSCS